MKVEDLINLLSGFPKDFEIKVIDAMYEEENELENNMFEIDNKKKIVVFRCF